MSADELQPDDRRSMAAASSESEDADDEVKGEDGDSPEVSFLEAPIHSTAVSEKVDVRTAPRPQFPEEDNEETEQPEEEYIALLNDGSFLEGEFDYGNNVINTSKYTVITFIPLNLFEQFRRIANIYFLMIIAIQCVPGITPFSVWTSVCPLAFILTVGAVKDGIEDHNRHLEDDKANSIAVHKLLANASTAQWTDIQSADLRVGDLIRIDRGEEVPADCIVLSTSNDDGSCYISTASLDGENAPKLRRSVKVTAHVRRVQDLIVLRGRIRCPPNSKSLHGFTGNIALWKRSLPTVSKLKGRRGIGCSKQQQHGSHGLNLERDALTDDGDYLLAQTDADEGHHGADDKEAKSAYENPEDYVLSALDDEHFLFRASKVVNTECVYAYVLFVGRQSKLMLNRNEVPFKFSKFEEMLNKCIASILVFNFCGCMLLGMGATMAREPFPELRRSDRVRSFFMDSATWLVLTSWMIPFSLYVTMELIKLIQSQWVAWDNNLVFYYGEPENVRVYMQKEAAEMKAKRKMRSMSPFASFNASVLPFLGRANDIDEDNEDDEEEYDEDVGGDIEEEEERRYVDERPVAEQMEGIVERRTARVKNSNLNEELGHVDYVFSDKTGTLTQNQMELHKCSVAARKYQNDVRSTESAAPMVPVILSEDYSPMSAMISRVFAKEKMHSLESTTTATTTAAAVESRLKPRVDALTPAHEKRDSHFVWNLLLCSATLPVPKREAPHIITASGSPSPLRLGTMDSSSPRQRRRQRDSSLEHVRDRSETSEMQGHYGAVNGVHSVPHLSDVADEIEFMSASPDEVAFAEALADLGVVVEDKSASQTVSVRLHPFAKNVRRKGPTPGAYMRTFTVLAVLNFTAARRRMTVVVEDLQTGEIVLYCKGADSTIFALCRAEDKALVSKSAKHVNGFAKMGSRTLVMAMRPIGKALFEEFDREFKRAELALSKREERIERAFALVEKELWLCGCTAVEDQMQEGVPLCVDKLKMAKIKVIMLTGDKQETAVSIGRQSHIIGRQLTDRDVLFMSAVHYKNRDRLDLEMGRLDQHMDAILQRIGGGMHAPADTGSEYMCQESSSEKALVINGDALELCLQEDLQEKFLKIFSLVDTVVCNRANPFQKAVVVQMVKRRLDGVVLAIGDGANDVSMIQSANVGVGIMGKEGTQAALAADFVIHRFRHLARLLFVHGRFSFLRTSSVALLSLYKNMAFNVSLAYFAFFSLFTAQTMFEPNMMSMFNVLFTFLFPLAVGAFEQDLDDSTAMNHPLAYDHFKRDNHFNLRQFGFWMLTAIWQSLVIFFICVFSTRESFDVWDASGKQGGMWPWGTQMLTATVLMICVKMMAETKHWNVTYYCSTILGVLLYFCSLALVSNWIDFVPDMFGVMEWVMAKPMFYILTLLCVTVCVVPGVLYNLYNREYNATLAHVLLEAEKFDYLTLNGQNRPTKDVVADYLNR